MYCTPEEVRKARAPHRCTNCGEVIEPGTEYVRWASYDDGKAFTNKMHPECLESLQEDSGSFEYMPYSGERPAREELTHNVRANRPVEAEGRNGSELSE